jgi:ADP-ribose pyrophosphatase
MKQVFKGKLLKVYIKKKRLPNGYTATYEMIRHPGAALVVPFISRDRIIMLRQLRPVIGSYIYELPAGTLDRNESPAHCARREIIEEAGYCAGKLTAAGSIYPVPGYSTERIFIYKAQKLRKVRRQAEKDEVIKTFFMTRAGIRRLIKSGKLTDAKTIAALALCGVI